MLPRPETPPSPSTEDWSVLKEAVTRFEEAWQRGPRPGIDESLPSGQPLRFRVLVELVHIDLELRLKAGEAARVEEYLARYPELASDRAIVLELIAAEHELRCRREPGLTFEEYLGRFPQYQAELAQRIPGPGHTTATAPGTPPRWHAEAPPAVDGYEILGLLGRGGMGIVYKARQNSLDRLVALKFLPAECARDPLWLSRFQREARTASALNHPHICTIYDTGESAGRPFLSMELIEGRTFEALVGERQGVDELARLLVQAARALAAAHGAGVVHRDIKPANLMVRTDGIVKVLDFGLARRLPARDTQLSTVSGVGTDPGTRIGTLLYMSPEQARAEAVAAASDIFSLGLILYELTTGQHPFCAASELDVLHAIATQAPLPPARLNPEIPAMLEGLILHMLAKDARLRPSVLEVEARLSRLTAKIPGKAGSRPPGTGACPTVGRQQERAALHSGFEQAAAGHGLLLCVTGEPGLGKTTLVESFLDELAAVNQACSVARGRCSERLAGAEAYLPFLEALDSLLQGEAGASAAQALKLLAPSWYVQLAPLAASDRSLAGAFAQAKEATQERRKRELGVFLQEVSRQRPVVLFLDDIHWADLSSVDLLAYLGGRCSAWRLLLVLTYRPSDLLRCEHPFGPVKLELQGRGVCREIALPFLSRDDVNRYLALAFAGHDFPEELAAVLHARTEGNPLFMVDLLRYLRDGGVIVQACGRCSLARPVPELQRELPESVRGMIQRKIDQLSMADRHLVMAASVQGPEFDSAVVAAVLGREAAEVEESLGRLERVHALVRFVREQTFPDAALTARYRFVHVLYQNALYAELQPTRKAAWSAAAARAILGHCGERSAASAAKLALLFEAARDHARAADCYLTAAENAARMFAHHEAMALARRGLAVLRALPSSSEQARLELCLQMALAMQVQVARGFADPEAKQIYDRAHALYERVQEAAQLFPVLWGLWLYYEVRGQPRKSRELAEHLLTLAQTADGPAQVLDGEGPGARDQGPGRAQAAGDPAQLLQARAALAITYLCLGDATGARDQAAQALALYDRKRHSSHAYLYGQDPGVACRAFGAVALWLLGYPDQAVQSSREAVALSRESGHPSTLVLALHFAAIVRQLRCEARAVEGTADAVMAIATEQGLSFWLAGGLMMRGWAVAERGAFADGIAQLRQGVTALAATGAETYRTYYFALLADALSKEGDVEEALPVLAEALSLTDASGEAYYSAELHRLRGELLLRQASAEGAFREAEDCFRRALALAREQHAKSLELRAAMSLTRLCRQRGRPDEGRPILAECYDWFSEGFDTVDLREAKGLLKKG